MQAASTRRRVRQGRVRRRSPQRAVDPEALKRFWSSLSLEAKQQLLQFEDRDICERAYVIQQMLWYSELMCIKSGVRVSDGGKGGHSYAMEIFEFKWHYPGEAWLRAMRGGAGEGVGASTPGHDVVPAAFVAREGFVEGEDFIERLEKRLGTPLQENLPTLRREEWASVFEPTANSWAEYEKQVLKLVRLALLQAHQEFQAASALETASPNSNSKETATAEAQDVVEVDFENDSLDPVLSSSAKRKTRKRRKAAAAAVAAANRADSCTVDDEVLGEAKEDEYVHGEEESKVPDGIEEEDEEDEEEEACEDAEIAAEDVPLEEENIAEAEQKTETTGSFDEESPFPTQDFEVSAANGIDDDGFTAWETVSRKRDRQRARPQPTMVPSVEEERRTAGGSTPSRHGASKGIALAVGEQATSEKIEASGVSESHAGRASAEARSPMPEKDQVRVASPVDTKPPAAKAVAARAVAAADTPTASSTAAEAWLSAWQPNAEKYKMWMPDASEAICIMASVKRTFLEVEPVLRSEKMQPRSRSVGPAICVC